MLNKECQAIVCAGVENQCFVPTFRYHEVMAVSPVYTYPLQSKRKAFHLHCFNKKKKLPRKLQFFEDHFKIRLLSNVSYEASLNNVTSQGLATVICKMEIRVIIIVQISEPSGGALALLFHLCLS